MVSPGAKQAWPIAAACWSPAMPVIGIGVAEMVGRASSPIGPAQSTISGKATRGTPNRSHRPSSQPPRKSISCGARGVGRVADVQPAGQLEDQPAVDRADAQIGRRRRAAAGQWSSAQRDLGRAEIGIEQQAGRRLHRRFVPGLAQRRRRCSAVRRSCHTIAGRQRRAAAPVPEDDRLALVGDADRRDPRRRRSPIASRAASSVSRQISSASCSTQPGRGIARRERPLRHRADARRRRRPASRACSTCLRR